MIVVDVSAAVRPDCGSCRFKACLPVQLKKRHLRRVSQANRACSDSAVMPLTISSLQIGQTILEVAAAAAAL